jgi:hypothetical protein
MTTSQLQLSQTAGALSSSTAASVSAGIASSTSSPPAISVQLDAGNFMLWKGLILPNIAGAGLHGYIDGTEVAPAKTISQGEGDAKVEISNPAYSRWWISDQRVVSLLLGSMEPDVAAQLVGLGSARAVWTAVHTMYGAQYRANIRHIRRQLQTLTKEDMSAAQYMHKMKSLADAMASAGAPVADDELIDYILTGLGSAFNPIAASLTIGNNEMTYNAFYSAVLSYEALQAQQSRSAEWMSSANAASRPGFSTGNSRPRDYAPSPYDGGRPAGAAPY